MTRLKPTFFHTDTAITARQRGGGVAEPGMRAGAQPDARAGTC